jgi:hypothetical protein
MRSFFVLVRARNCSAARNSVPVPLQSTDSGRDSELRVAFAASIVGWRLPRGRVACVPHSITGSPPTVTSSRGAASHAAVRSRVLVLVAVQHSHETVRTNEQAQRPWPRHVQRVARHDTRVRHGVAAWSCQFGVRHFHTLMMDWIDSQSPTLCSRIRI